MVIALIFPIVWLNYLRRYFAHKCEIIMEDSRLYSDVGLQIRSHSSQCTPDCLQLVGLSNMDWGKWVRI